MKTVLLSRVLALALAANVIGAALAGAPTHAAGSQATRERGGALPAALAGGWGFTTISGTTYWDKTTGAYMGSGNGGSQTYTFYRDGRYKLFNYIKTNSYGWETQALTWEEGTVAVNGSTLTLKPTSGRYKVMDSQVRKNNYTRAMTARERKVKKFLWKIEVRNGKPVLRMGRSQDSLSEYKKQA